MKLALRNRIGAQYNQAALTAIVGEIERQVNALAEGRIAGRHFTASAIPTSGDFAKGDIVWNSAPAADGPMGWVCTVAGSPGTLEEFGLVGFTGVTTDGEYRSVQVFTASGTWTKPAGLARVTVTVVGGGASGAGAQATGVGEASIGGGGAAGGASIKTIEAASLGATETVTVGAGGAAVSNAVGNAGGTSSFGTHCSATGGGTAEILGNTTGNRTAKGGAGGVGSSGDINIQGGAGIIGVQFPGASMVSGGGGDSIFGGGAVGVHNDAAGTAAGNYGGGGSGAANSSSQSARAGGNGTPGIVIVEEFF